MKESSQYIPLGVFRTNSQEGASVPPSRWVELIHEGLIDGFEDDGRYYIHRESSIPKPQPQPIWITWARNHYREIKKAASRRGIEFSLSKEDLYTLLGVANGACQVSGIRFTDEKPDHAFRRPWMPSLDRIDSSKGYTIKNCRIVCVAVNSAINEFGLDALVAISHGILAGQDGNK